MLTLWTFMIFLPFLVIQIVPQNLTTLYFVQRPLCNVTERLNHGCMSTRSNYRSLLQCASLCAGNMSCIGCSKNSPAQVVYEHSPCPEIGGCDAENSSRFIEKESICLNGGTWDGSIERCTCVDYWAGTFCHRKPKSCLDLELSGYLRGYHRVNISLPGLTDEILCLCWVSGKYIGSSLLLFRNTGLGGINANRNWLDYKSGFFESKYNNGWLGLDSMRRILNHFDFPDVTLRITLNGTYYSQIYKNFQISSEATGYVISFQSVKFYVRVGNESEATETTQAEACFTPLQNVKFSTTDKDNDDDPTQNCAALAGNGWWFRSCNETCNLFLPLYDSLNPGAERYDRIRSTWLDLRANAQYLSSISMYIWQNINSV